MFAYVVIVVVFVVVIVIVDVVIDVVVVEKEMKENTWKRKIK